MTFRDAVQATHDVSSEWQAGLRALKRADRNRIRVKDSRSLAGSIDVDGSLRGRYPNDHRWDYGIGQSQGGDASDMVYWVEVHPATDGQVTVVLKKLEWLTRWLDASNSPLTGLEKEFTWVSSGTVSATLSAPMRRQLAERHGLRFVGRHLNIK